MKKGIHYEDSFAPCTKLETLQLISAIASQKKWRIRHADIPHAYLHGKMDRLMFTHVPLYWNEIIGNNLGLDGSTIVLEKTLYSAPHAGRQWNFVIHKFLTSLGFNVSPNEATLYIHKTEQTTIALYVDDIFITEPNEAHIDHTLQRLKDEFKVHIEDNISYALSIQFERSFNSSYFMSQTAYIDSIVKHFNQTHS